MKNVLVFIVGVIVGIAGIGVMAEKLDLGITLFEQGEKALSMRKLKVFQVIDTEGALVLEGDLPYKVGQKPQAYFLLHDEQNLYYDNQEIQVSKGMEVKQIGVYRYEGKKGRILTVPAIRIESIKTEKK